MKKIKAIVLVLSFLGTALLSACSRKNDDGTPKEPGTFFPTYPCITCSDGTLYCSDVHRDHC